MGLGRLRVQGDWGLVGVPGARSTLDTEYVQGQASDSVDIMPPRKRRMPMRRD